MNLLLLVPLGLAALAALLLPLLLHLARRSEPRETEFAALRWLRPRPQPRRRHRLEELLLLLVRLLLLALLALLLARPVLFGRPDLRPYVALAPGVDAASARAAVRLPDARWHRLAPGFPELGETTTPKGSRTPGVAGASVPSLLRELDATLPPGVPLTVVVPPVLDDADAQRPLLSRRVDWRVQAGAPARSAAAPSAAAAATTPPRFALAVRHAADRAASLPYLRAADAAWSVQAGGTSARNAAPAAAPRIDIAPTTQPLDPRTRNLAWLAPGEVPQAVRAWIAGGGRALLDAGTAWPGMDDAPVPWHDADGALVRGLAFGRGRVMRLQRPLLPASMPGLLEPDFPRRLRALFDDPPPAPARVDAADYAPRTGAAPWPEQPRPLAPWLLWAVALAFLLERWLATGRRRGHDA